MYDVIRYNAPLLIKAISWFGIRKQKRKTEEELIELVQAIKNDLDGRPHNVEEEIADVYIMLGQMRLLYDQSKIDEFIEEKLERLKGRIEQR